MKKLVDLIIAGIIIMGIALIPAIAYQISLL